jgi:predicted enzyme related to lactoylglutathione lyase
LDKDIGGREMPSIVHFEIPADDLDRAREFYTNLFGWKIESFSGMDYMMIDTYGPGGGMMKRVHPGQQITDYFGVPSVDEYAVKVEGLGGKVLMPKTAVPGMGYFVICQDTEGNVFGIWEMDMGAK